MFTSLLWNMLLTAGIAALLLTGTRTRFLRRRPSLRHTLWLLLLLKLITPAWIELPILPSWRPNVSPNVAHLDFVEIDATKRPLGDLTSKELTRGTPVPNSELATIDLRSEREAPFPIWSLLLAGSMAGTLTLSAIYYVRTARLRRWMRRAINERQQLTECCNEVAQKLGIKHDVACHAVDARTTPLLWGVWRPSLIVPCGLVDSLNREQLQGVVAHELAHYVRRDPWSNLFAFFVKVLMWWNPITWLAHREVRAAQELCCDAIAIGVADRRNYATALLQTLNFVQKGPFAKHQLALGVEENGSILRRFEMIADAKLSHRLPRIAFPLLLVGSVGLVCLPVNGQRTSDVAKDTAAASGDLTSQVASWEETGKTLFLGALIEAKNRGDHTAWVFDRTSGTRKVVQAGDVLPIADRKIQLIKITPTKVVVSIDGTETQWSIGESLSNVVQKLKDPVGKSAPQVGVVGSELTVRGKSGQLEHQTTADESVLKESAKKETQDPVSVQVELIDDRMIIRGSQHNVKQVTDLIGSLEKRGAENKKQNVKTNAPVLMVYKLGKLDPKTALSVFQTLMSEKDVRLDVDMKANHLIVLATKQEHKSIRAVLEQLQGPPQPSGVDPFRSTRGRKDRIQFSFKNAPWMKVLDWFAETAGLSLVADRVLPGTMSYTDPRNYSIDESMDVLNGLLLTKGYALFRRDRVLYFVYVNNGVPKELVSPISYDQLSAKGNYECVSVMFPIGDRDPQKVRKEIMPLLTRPGSVDLFPATRQVLVTDRKNRMPSIKLLIGSISEPEKTDNASGEAISNPTP